MVEAYKPLYTVKEAATVLRCNASKVYDLINTGQMPYLILGQKKIRGSDLESFIEKYPMAVPGEGGDKNGQSGILTPDQPSRL